MTSRDFPDEIADESSKRNEVKRPNKLSDGFKVIPKDSGDLDPRRGQQNEPVYGLEPTQQATRKLANFTLNTKMAAMGRGDQTSASGSGGGCILGFP